LVKPLSIAPVPNVGPIDGPAGIRVRMYRVGFGDFFLLSLKSGGGDVAHVLIDCGVHAKPTSSIDDAIAQLALDTGGKLALIVMTHRHADHISGFASGRDIFGDFEVERVWMPWFENRQDAQATRIQAGITALAGHLGMALAARSVPGDAQYLDMVGNITGALSVAGRSSNEIALDTLHSGFAGGKAKVDYLKAGDNPQLPKALDGIGMTARILGPPVDPALVSQMDGRNHQYLAQLAAGADVSPSQPFPDQFAVEADTYDASGLGRDYVTAVEKAIADAQPDVVRAMTIQADNTINNQSLVILFEFNGKKLLFAGDAQWGNWQGFLFGGALGSPGHTELTEEAKAVLGSIDFYKVGHHGSTNATPIDALEAMREGFVAMCSTAVDAYGSVDNESEVPRAPLMAALDKKTGGKLARSDQAPVGDKVTFDAPLDAAFTMPTGMLFIDYQL